jgi:alpha-galactosidase
MPIKIAFIGAGSFGFTRKLVRDILLVPELRDVHFALHDIDAQALDRMAAILRREIEGNKLAATVSTDLDRRAALDGANYILSAVRIGGLEAFEGDVDIPLKYGIDQCVGDTLCIGGIMYGQRNVPQMLAFQKDAKDVAANGCLFLNYANPMAINTWAALDAADRGEGVDTIGLCHGVEGGWWQIDSALAQLHGEEETGFGDTDARHARTQVICAGINHQTWYTKILFKGREIDQAELVEAFEKHDHLPSIEPVRIDVLKRMGLYSTESNGHLSEYLPWYRKNFRTDPTAAKRWVGQGNWIHGETGGYLRVTTEARHLFDADFERLLGEAGGDMADWQRSSEHGSHIIEARETNRPYRGHFNVRNRGIVPQLAPDCIVEAPGYVDATGLHMMNDIALPQGCAATCATSVNVQRMAKDAAVNGDVTLLKQAVLHDPLTGAILEPEAIWQMVDEMLVAQRQWLPNYAESEFGEAAARLADAEEAGTRVAPLDWQGSARRRTRTVEELQAENDDSLLDADKGNVAPKKAADEAA